MRNDDFALLDGQSFEGGGGGLGIETVQFRLCKPGWRPGSRNVFVALPALRGTSCTQSGVAYHGCA
jgi:hypothetical protein